MRGNIYLTLIQRIMKKLLIIITIISSQHLFAANPVFRFNNGCSMELTQQDVVTITGTMMLKADVWVIHGTEGKSGEVKDYYPSNLGQEFKIEGQRVIVEATMDPIPDNVRLAGTPITITKMTRI